MMFRRTVWRIAPKMCPAGAGSPRRYLRMSAVIWYRKLMTAIESSGAWLRSRPVVSP
jgi:hypothetical protein